MKAVAIGVVVLAGLLGAGYLFIRSDAALLGDDVSLKIASTDVLGNSLHGQSCPRASYASDVESLHSAGKAGAAVFKFHPIAGKEVPCPPITVIVDRKTGEAWISK
jgi:hypothetical protein